MVQPLDWFRSNCGKFAWLAFFALACQFALTFGHVHLSTVSVSAAFAISADSASDSAGLQSSPTRKAPTGRAQDFCAVCSNISLATTLISPVSPAAIPPISIIQNLQWSLAAIDLASYDRFHFGARGPPQA